MPKVQVVVDEAVELPEGLGESMEQQLLQLLNYAKLDKELNLLITSDERMLEMNSTFRGKEKTTDVLSFPYPEEDPLLGELAISLPVAKTQATENGWELSTELTRLLVHGFGHLLGYDHEISMEEEREMLALEVKLLGILGLDRIYPDHQS